ncbi:MAG: ABC transporter permease [Alphaproteobacteria bacterium]|nr:ABC transporter permease [Alphaproteobacteria bacterium]MDX5368967.1 ABC transporter permease [Alphaproteobacteria bacterium]MDX5463662.1 ABC transporter permease [Alphaproteobacteria bacterium]
MPRRWTETLARAAVLGLPLAALFALILGPLAITLVISFWEKTGFSMRPAFSAANYAAFFSGVRLEVLLRSLWVAVSATVIMLLIAYPIAYLVATRVREALVRPVLFLFAVPFLVNYVVRTFAWSDLLSRNGLVNSALVSWGIADAPLDWLLYSDFAVYLGLVTAYMPFMVFPIWLSLSGIDHRLVEASWMLGEGPFTTFRKIVLPLSLPGVIAAAIFGFVGAFGEVAVSLILGGTGYQLLGNAIQSALNVLHYPLAAAISSVSTLLMLALLIAWSRMFDIRLFLGKIMGR